MRVWRAFVVHEVKLGLRSPRLWLLSAVYVLLAATPVVALYVMRQTGYQHPGPASYAAKLFMVQPFLTVLLAAVLSIGAINRERDEQSFAVVALAPQSNAGYLLRRWLAIQTILVPLTLVPVVVTAGLVSIDQPAAIDVETFVGPWLLHVVPLAVVVSAIALGLGTIAGGTFSGMIAALLVFGVGFGLFNDVLARFGRQVSGPATWFGVVRFLQSVGSLRYSYGLATPATDGPYDAVAAAELLARQGAVTAGLGAVVLGLAVAFLRRTRRDLRPWSIRSDHPLRTVLGLLNRLRQAAAPDPGLAPGDRAVVAAGLALLAAALVLNFHWDSRYRVLAAKRYEAEISERPRPTPAEATPGSWRIEGAIERGGRVRLRVAGVMLNHGAGPVERLAFDLDPHLTTRAVASDRGEVTLRATWDRLELRLDPPLEPGGKRRLEFDLEGVPGTDRFALKGDGSFVSRYESFLDARYAHQIPDLARSSTERAVSARRVRLVADSLTPVPRYSPWELTPPATTQGESGREVVPESSFPLADVEIDLRAPRSWILADACGGFSHVEGSRARLQSACRIPIARIGVLGGGLRRIDPTPGLGGMAVLAAHADSAELHLPSFVEAARLAGEAWPGLDPLSDSVVLEWPPEFDLDPTRGMWQPWRWNDGSDALESVGRVLLVPESMMVQRTPLAPARIAVSAVTFELMNRRRVREDQQLFFDWWFRTVVATRMGESTARAVISAPVRGHHGTALAEPLIEAGRWNAAAWNEKLPALIAEIERRIGGDNLVGGIEEFLAGDGRGPGTVEELFDALSERSGVRLQRLYSDYVAGTGLPLLSLSAVRFDRRDGAWVVAGLVENRGAGETTCPVVLRTDVGTIETEVRVDTSSAEPFRLASRQRPRSVELDPRGTCFRLEPRPREDMVDRVEYHGES